MTEQEKLIHEILCNLAELVHSAARQLKAHAIELDIYGATLYKMAQEMHQRSSEEKPNEATGVN